MFKSYKLGTYNNNFRIFEVLASNAYDVTSLEITHGLANDTDFVKNLNKRQRYYIEKYDNVVNKHIPSRPHKEWREVNHDYLIQAQKEYRDDHREKISQQKQQRNAQKVARDIPARYAIKASREAR